MSGRIKSQPEIKKLLSGTALPLLLSLICLMVAANPSPQDDEDSTRKIWNKRFQTAREKAAKAASPAKPVTTNSKPKPTDKTGGESNEPRYSESPVAASSEALDEELIGISLWLLREAKTIDDSGRARMLVQKNNTQGQTTGQLVEHLAERVGSNMQFGSNDKLRIGIEVPRIDKNYVYVIDREVYSDGGMSKPYLIFPAKSTPRGDEEAIAGKLIYVPSQNDPIPYFSLQKSRTDQISEQLTIIISPHPLNLSPGDEPLQLNQAQVAQWEKEWGGPAERRETRSVTSQAWTVAEKEAGEGKRRLVQNDPLPQIIYRVKAKQGAPLLINVPLRIAQ